MLQLSNPRKHAVIENWPSGRNRVTATFDVETGKQGERVSRVTTGKPKRTTYCKRMAIVDGDDGKTYLIGETNGFGQMILMPATMAPGTKYFHAGSEEDKEGYEQIQQLLKEI